jgi:rhodanese-related sulfurtransferase
MTHKKLILLVKGLLLAILMGAAGASVESRTSDSKILPSPLPTVTWQEVQHLRQQGKALIVDTRTQAEYDLGHLQGALHLPSIAFIKYYPTVGPTLKKAQNKVLILYCCSHQCGASQKVARQLQAKGYKDLYLYPGGWNEWVSKGLK